jgi:hypothetical protein
MFLVNIADYNSAKGRSAYGNSIKILEGTAAGQKLLSSYTQYLDSISMLLNLPLGKMDLHWGNGDFLDRTKPTNTGEKKIAKAIFTTVNQNNKSFACVVAYANALGMQIDNEKFKKRRNKW